MRVRSAARWPARLHPVDGEPADRGAGEGRRRGGVRRPEGRSRCGSPRWARWCWHTGAACWTGRAMEAAIDRFKAGDGRVDIGTFQSVSNVIAGGGAHAARGAPQLRHQAVRGGDQPAGRTTRSECFDGRVGGDVTHLKLLDDPYLLVSRAGAFPGGPVPLARLDGLPWWRTRRSAIRSGWSRRWPVAASGRTSCSAVGNEAVLSMVRAGMGSAYCRGSSSPAAAPRPTRLTLHELRRPPAREILVWQGAHHSARQARDRLAAAAEIAAGADGPVPVGAGGPVPEPAARPPTAR